MLLSCCTVKPAPAKQCSPTPSMQPAQGTLTPLSRLTVALSPKKRWKKSYSAIKQGPSPEPCGIKKDYWKKRAKAASCSTKSAKWTLTCKTNYYWPWNGTNISNRERPDPPASISASFPPPKKTLTNCCMTENSGKTYSTASMYSP